MEDRLDVRFQIHPGHRLRDPVRHGRYPEHANPFASCFGDLHRFHRRREIAARRQAIPDPLQVVAQVLLELCNGLAIDSRRTLVRFHPLIRFPHFTLGNTKRFRFIHAGPPLSGCPPNKAGQRRPFGPVPLQNLQPYYGRLRPCAPPRYARSCGDHPLELLPSHRDDRFLRSSPKPVSRSRRLHAGCRLGSLQAPPNLVPGPKFIPGFDIG